MRGNNFSDIKLKIKQLRAIYINQKLKQKSKMKRQFKFKYNIWNYVDATKHLQIVVTENDAKNGVINDRNYCPVALALKRIYPYAFIMRDTAVVIKMKKGIMTAVKYRMEHKLNQAIKLYEQTSDFPTGVYVLKAPTLAQRLL